MYIADADLGLRGAFMAEVTDAELRRMVEESMRAHAVMPNSTAVTNIKKVPGNKWRITCEPLLPGKAVGK